MQTLQNMLCVWRTRQAFGSTSGQGKAKYALADCLGGVRLLVSGSGQARSRAHAYLQTLAPPLSSALAALWPGISGPHSSLPKFVPERATHRAGKFERRSCSTILLFSGLQNPDQSVALPVAVPRLTVHVKRRCGKQSYVQRFIRSSAPDIQRSTGAKKQPLDYHD